MTLAEGQASTVPAGSVNLNGSKADDVNLDALPINTVDGTPQDIFTTSEGLKFKLYKVNSHIILEANKQMREPKVPVVFIADKGREEENPNDPDYQAALQNFNMERGLLVVNTHLAFGTKLMSQDNLPEGKQRLEEDEWTEDLREMFGIEVPAKGKARYLRWLKFHLLAEEDMNALAVAVMRYSGRVTEADVVQAEDAFRNSESGPADQGLPAGAEVRSTNSDNKSI